MSKFEKVSKQQYLSMFAEDAVAAESVNYDDITLPFRKTQGSAGYDFVSPSDYMIGDQPVLIPTGIRCCLNHGAFLMIVPRSSYGFKYGMELVNTAGIIDEDYCLSDNEGHIMIKVKSSVPFMIHRGDSFAQGIILPYGVCTGDAASQKRNGGIGSTGN